MASTIIALACLAGAPAAAQGLLTGRYDCILESQGACGEGPEGVCLGARIRRGPPVVFLKLDFARNRAELNGIGGSIHRDAGTGIARIHWSDLSLLGSPTVAMNDFGGRLIAGLRFQGSTADFVCRRTDGVRRG